MKRSKTQTMLLIGARLILSVFATSAAQGNTVDIVNDGFGANDVATFWSAGYSGADVVAGLYMLDKTGDTGIGDTWSNGLIPGFCIELHEPAPHATYTYDVGAPDDTYNSYTGQTLGTTKANYLRELWATYYDPAWAAGGSYTSEQNGKAAAFAAAVWEIVYEDLPTSPAGWDVTSDGTAGSGGFYAAGLDSFTANKWLHGLTGNGPKADLRVFTNQGGQDYLVAVPEPATIMLLGLGGAFSVFSRRRRPMLKARA
ncbi:MAG: PEP-CTERM sorting domain-containing protein [Sedimentisphaerales bacterium]|nr:PEP-CTERM sorting domain-containing protein [Sedimentisphaerales bacterium]